MWNFHQINEIEFIQTVHRQNNHGNWASCLLWYPGLYSFWKSVIRTYHLTSEGRANGEYELGWICSTCQRVVYLCLEVLYWAHLKWETNILKHKVYWHTISTEHKSIIHENWDVVARHKPYNTYTTPQSLMVSTRPSTRDLLVKLGTNPHTPVDHSPQAPYKTCLSLTTCWHCLQIKRFRSTGPIIMAYMT
jgi:hypothetical protein